MRHAVLVLALLACSSLGGCDSKGTSIDEDPTTPDASDPNKPPDPPPDPPPPARGFQIVSPDVTIMPGQEITYCYYFRTPNTENMVIKKWSATMTPGSHHMIMYTTSSDVMPPGTVSSQSCGGFSGNNLPSWTFASQTPTAEMTLPADDGAGKPLGQEIPTATPGYLQMHYLNASDEPIQAHVTINADAYDAGATYTKTAAFITYNSQISVPPNAMNDVESQTCNTPANAKFWTLSTHAHKQAIDTTIKDGATVVFNSTDWEHPGAKKWSSAPYHQFASGKITYACTYKNTGSNANRTVTSGPSAQTDEMCMATGYYFPATKSLFCLNNLGPF